MKRRSILARGVLLAYAALAAACASLSAPSRPPPTASRPDAASAPAPSSPNDTRQAPNGDATARLPAPSPQPPPSQPPARDVPAARPQSDASGASSALLEQSRAQRAAGSLPAARASLERALRLDPNNAALWLELGELELQTGNSTQAATMARKAMTLAGRDRQLTDRAARLLRAAE
jgi:tetratricopeptide (TPR) repeat protein